MSEQVLKFMLLELEARMGDGWLGAKRFSASGQGGVAAELEKLGLTVTPRLRARLVSTDDFVGLLHGFSLKSVRLDSQMGLLGWLKSDYPLTLRFDIPSPEEMLETQVEGRRFVSLLKLEGPIGRHAGPLEFLLHDLEHAHKFFGDPVMTRAQIAFFRFLRASLGRFERWLDDEQFVKDLNYLKSDMNSHPVHLFKFLKAIVLTATLRRGSDERFNDFWVELLSEWPVGSREAALRINNPGLERREDALELSSFFELKDTL